MPQISSFLGVIIKMFYRDHNPPHFHASYGEYEYIFDIDLNNVPFIIFFCPNFFVSFDEGFQKMLK